MTQPWHLASQGHREHPSPAKNPPVISRNKNPVWGIMPHTASSVVWGMRPFSALFLSWLILLLTSSISFIFDIFVIIFVFVVLSWLLEWFKISNGCIELMLSCFSVFPVFVICDFYCNWRMFFDWAGWFAVNQFFKYFKMPIYCYCIAITKIHLNNVLKVK